MFISTNNTVKTTKVLKKKKSAVNKIDSRQLPQWILLLAHGGVYNVHWSDFTFELKKILHWKRRSSEHRNMIPDVYVRIRYDVPWKKTNVKIILALFE